MLPLAWHSIFVLKYILVGFHTRHKSPAMPASEKSLRREENAKARRHQAKVTGIFMNCNYFVPIKSLLLARVLLIDSAPPICLSSPLIGDTTKSEIKGQKFNSLEQQRKDRLLHIQRVLSAPSSHANLILSPYSRPNTKVSIRLLYNLYLPLLLARRSRYGEGAPIKFSPKFCTSGWNFKHRTAAPIEVVWPVVVGE